ncbi:acetylornithine aminotransferase [Candidatus Marinamargulisbacteria bacterium SCGC AAA071-K20]|nr:acetylornithine aminotransferase [Candidatus Marinamargulisbacteria bacterium SCGC AAA071-K20]
MKNSLHFKQFNNDPRVKEAKALLLDALSDHQSKLTKVKSPQDYLKKSYSNLIDNFSKKRGGNLFYPYLSSGFGNGALVELADGSVKYDFISGIGAHFSHLDPDCVAASIDASMQDTIMQGNLQQNVSSVKLVQKLTQLSKLDHAFLTTSGAMAVENGLKLAMQKNSPASRVLAFQGCFMGRTLACASITDKDAYRKGIPTTLNVDYLPFYNSKKPDQSTARTLKKLYTYLTRYPGQYACMCFELIQGERGYFPGSTAFFTAIMTVLKKHNVAIFVDEIQSFGRLDTPFAFQHFGLEKFIDIVTVGKLSQVCATLFNKNYKPQPGLISQTFTSSTVAIESSLTILNKMEKEAYWGPKGKIMTLSNQFRNGLKALHKKYPKRVNGPYGYGGMLVFTLDDGSKENTVAFIKHLYSMGLMSFIAGANPTRVRFLMPIGGVNKIVIKEVLSLLESAIKAFKN